MVGLAGAPTQRLCLRKSPDPNLIHDHKQCATECSIFNGTPVAMFQSTGQWNNDL